MAEVGSQDDPIIGAHHKNNIKCVLFLHYGPTYEPTYSLIGIREILTNLVSRSFFTTEITLSVP
jgi:hypothetical protein